VAAAREVRHVLTERLSAVREKRQRSQTAVAREAGLHQTALSKIERGIRDVSVEDLLALAYVLTVNPVDLILPPDDDPQNGEEPAPIRIAPGAEYPAIWVRGWLSGNGPLPRPGEAEGGRFPSLDLYYAEAPERVRRRHAVARHPLIEELGLLQLFATDAILGDHWDGARHVPGIPHPDSLAEAIREHGERVKAYADLLAAEVVSKHAANRPGAVAPQPDTSSDDTRGSAR
jgi:transcriptional regulator with XRE-family HTH domain